MPFERTPASRQRPPQGQPGFPPGFPSGFPSGGQPGFPPGFPSGGQPGFPPGFPSGGQPGFPPGGPPGFPSGGQQGGPPTASSNTPPSGPPPNFIPSEAQATTLSAGPGGDVSTFAIDAGAIFPCRFRFTYIWLNNGRSFWSYIVFVGRNSIAGWRYTGRRWVYFGIDLRRIRSFYCR